MTTRILIVDDELGMCEMLQSRLATRGFTTEARTSPREAIGLLTSQDFDAVVADINMRELNGVEFCRLVLEARSDMPVILITAFGTMSMAIEAMRAGAHDFLPKPFEIEQLARTIERAVTIVGLRDEVRRLKQAVEQGTRPEHLIGKSPEMAALSALITRIADCNASVLITGESGTGKELVARAIHDQSPRARGPFVAVNCAAMPEQLLESELFGHAKGAFTDARTAKKGLFLTADGGTIFLDELAELPVGLQAKLLRALQERTIRPVGSDTEVPFDARVLSATNRDLEAMIEQRRFRQDLYFRVNVIQVELPPLRGRGGDVLLLAQHFLERISARAHKAIEGFGPAAAARLLAYPWPGNVRELQNTVERAVALASFARIEVSDLPEKIRDYRTAQIVLDTDDPTGLISLEELERRYVLRVLEAVYGNKSAAARVLGIERKTLYRMLERWRQAQVPPVAAEAGNEQAS
jgi:DNA-binding NtrC family response regulator